MLNDIVRTAFAAMGYDIATEFRDWPSALTATEKLQFTGIFPYDSTQKQLPHFFYSKPLYSGSIRAFTPAERPLAAVTPETLRGMHWCGAETLWPPADLPLARRLDSSLPAAPTLETCFTLLLQAQVELVVADELHAYAVLHTMRISDRIRMLDNALGSHTLHLLLPKFASRSHALMYEFDQSLALLEKAGVLNEITTRHRQPYPDTIPSVSAPLQRAERQP
jgi:polar amino acid transport system substrate-binding protein